MIYRPVARAADLQLAAQHLRRCEGELIRILDFTNSVTEFCQGSRVPACVVCFSYVEALTEDSGYRASVVV